MELRQYLTVVWKWTWLIVLAALIAGVTSFFWNSRQPKIYQASTSLLVGTGLEQRNPQSGDLFTSQQLAQTYIQIARTDPVLQGVVDTLKLPFGSDQLRGAIYAGIIPGTQLIELRVVDTDPRRAQLIADAYAAQVIAQGPAARAPDEIARREFVQRQIEDIQKKIDDSQIKIDELQRSIAVTSSAKEIADKQQQIAAMQSQRTTWQTTYATLLTVLAPQGSNSLSVVESARLPQYPIAPNVASNVMFAALIGAALAVVGAFLVEYLDDTIKTPEDVAQSLELANLGAIGTIWGNGSDARLIAAKYPRASHSEAYRALRTNIQVSSLDQPIKTLLVTSANPKEGKSITSANLGVVMALGGLRVLLIDADMRRPQQHKIFNLSNEFGLVNALLHPEARLDTYTQPTETENLVVLTTGPHPPNPAELLDSKRMQELIERFKAQFDLLIFDTPPILPRIDAAVLARHLDATLLVVDAGHTRRDSAMRAKETLARAGGKILGVALNRISSNNAYYYYYYYSDEGKNYRLFGSLRSSMERMIRQLGQHLPDSK
ncbi:MAG: polysaccharide biosynthesis tyrosine autokinase [Chloroflexi bacterium]|nr:polysaccharide biosynthesis tyrosine autokinase [Chloroflexota bacterium]